MGAKIQLEFEQVPPTPATIVLGSDGTIYQGNGETDRSVAIGKWFPVVAGDFVFQDR